MAKYIDIGANLTCEQFKNHTREIIDDSKKWDVERIIITGTTVANSFEAQKMVKDHNDYKLYFTAGIHPHNAKTCNNETINKLRELLKDPLCVAVGECGLDYDRMFSTKDDQIKWFEEQIKLAIEVNKPLFLHEREAFDDFYEILSKYSGKVKGVVHCFTGNKDHLEKYLSIGMHIGITGWVCDSNKGRNSELIAALKSLPVDKLMIETDSPYLCPIKGKTNYPAYIAYVVEKCASIMKINPIELANKCHSTTIDFFNLK